MSEETLKPLDLNQAKSHSQISFESLAEVKTTPSFFQKITTFFSSNIVNYICTLVIIILATAKLILTLPRILNTVYYRKSFYSQWVDGLVILTQLVFMIVQIPVPRLYSFCQFNAVVFLGLEMLMYSAYATCHAFVMNRFSKKMYIDCMTNLIERGEIKAFEENYNYRCDTFIKDCVSYYEDVLDCPMSLMQDKMENILICRKIFLAQTIMLLVMIIVFHIKIANFLKFSDSMTNFKKLKSQYSMKWYPDVILDKEKNINLMKKDINISLNQINNYIEYDEENNDKIVKSNKDGEVDIDHFNDDDDSGGNNNGGKDNSQEISMENINNNDDNDEDDNTNNNTNNNINNNNNNNSKSKSVISIEINANNESKKKDSNNNDTKLSI